MADHPRSAEQFSLLFFFCLFGFCLHCEPVAFSWRGEAVSSAAARALPGVPGRPAPPQPGRDGPFFSLILPKFGLWAAGLGVPLPLLCPCSTRPPPLIQPRSSSSSYHPHPCLPQVPRRALSARDWRRTRGPNASGRGVQGARALAGAGAAGRPPPAGAGGGHRRGLLAAARAARTRALAKGRQVR